MWKFYIIIIFGSLALLMNSCFTSHLASESQIKQSIPQSKFANAESVGMKKDDIIKKYGLPVSTSVEQVNNVTKEELYYIEILGDIQIVTIITLQNGSAIKQKVDQITSNYDERFKKLQKDLKILQTPRLYN